MSPIQIAMNIKIFNVTIVSHVSLELVLAQEDIVYTWLLGVAGFPGGVTET